MVPLRLSKNKVLISVALIITFFTIAILFQPWLNPIIALSLVSVVAFGIIAAFFKIDFLFSLIVITLPFSFNFSFTDAESSIMFPSEVLMSALTITALYKLFIVPEFGREFIKHPLTRFIIAYFLLQLLSSCFSNLYVVSIKFIIIRFCYILVFYFLTHLYIKSALLRGIKIHLLYAYALVPIILYVLIRHGELNFGRGYASIMPEPFYNDHTIYSACIMFVLPAVAAGFIFSITFKYSSSAKIIFFLLLLLLCIAIFFSYSRGAWISLVVSLLFIVVLLLRIRVYFILLLMLIAGVTVYKNQDSIILNFKQNKFDSNVRDVQVDELAKSITNINNDLSNAERLNRWICAVRMAHDKPWFGHGPGTFQFNYLQYQQPSEMTWISVKSPYNIQKGRGGTTHSEYLLLLSESGIFAFLSFLLLIIAVIYISMKNFYTIPNKQLKIVIAVMLAGFISYITHGIFNNFLDTDKAAFLFWSSISILATIDIYKQTNTGIIKE
jgi:putative inorganic carbon (HCO3(-)) transporter